MLSNTFWNNVCTKYSVYMYLHPSCQSCRVWFNENQLAVHVITILHVIKQSKESCKTIGCWCKTNGFEMFLMQYMYLMPPNPSYCTPSVFHGYLNKYSTLSQEDCKTKGCWGKTNVFKSYVMFTWCAFIILKYYFIKMTEQWVAMLVGRVM